MTLHPVVRLAQRSAFSALDGGAPDAVLPAYGKENRDPRKQRIAPFSCYKMDRVRIPTTMLTPSPGRHYLWPKGLAIFFNPVSPIHEKDYGVRFLDVKHGRVADMRDADEGILARVPQPSAEFRILWPGYGHLERSYAVTVLIGGRPVTRWELAQQVVRCYERFLEEEARRAHCAPNNTRWDVNNIRFEDLVLVSFSNCHGHDAVFQAVVEVAA